MRSVSRLALACAIASSVVAFGVHGAAAAPITDPTGTVSVATDGSCAQTGFGVAVSTTGCANGTVAVSGTGQAFGGVAVSGTGQAVTDSDLTPFAVSGTGNAAGSGDMGAYTVSGLGTATGSNGVDVAGGNACGTGANVEISVFGSTCGAPISVCVTCHVPAAHLDWYHQGLRRF